MKVVTTRERIDEVLDGLPESELEPLLEIIVSRTKPKSHDHEDHLESNGDGGPSGTGNGAGVKAKKRKRLSFSGIGAGDLPDASERVDELVGLAIDKRHPPS